jgi:hypothetical protein
MSNAYREASSPPRLDTAHMASKSDRASGSADDPFAVDQADATGQCLYGRRWPAVACSSHGRRGEHAQALALPNRQESKPVVLDLVGPLWPGRDGSADGRKAGLDKAHAAHLSGTGVRESVCQKT